MSLETGQRLTRYAWDAIPMPDNVIARVNLLGKDQPEELTFFDRKGRPIGDVELPGVDTGDDDRNEPELVPEIAPMGEDPADDDDLNPPPTLYAPPADPFPDPDVGPPEPTEATPEAEPLIEPAPVTVQAPPAEAPAPAGPPVPPMEPATPGVRRSTRTRVQAKLAYEPSFTGKKY